MVIKRGIAIGAKFILEQVNKYQHIVGIIVVKIKLKRANINLTIN